LGTLPLIASPEDRLIPWLAANAREMDPHDLTEYALVDEQQRAKRDLIRDAKVKPAVSEAPVMPVDWGTW
jgi:hypothetical protein